MDLTPEDRQRIYLEEKARLEARPPRDAKKAGFGCAAMVFVSLGAFILALILGFNGKTPETSAVTKAVAVIWYCGEQDAALDMILAASRNDMAALAGLISRGKLSRIEKGVRVRVHYEDGPLSRVSVQTGFLSGEVCWIPSRLLE